MTPLYANKPWQESIPALAKAAGALVWSDHDDWGFWRPAPGFKGQGSSIGNDVIRMAVEAGLLQVTGRDADGLPIEVKIAA